MNRKDFLNMSIRAAIAAGAFFAPGALLKAFSPDSGREGKPSEERNVNTNTFTPKRAARSYEGLISAPPERVFPLLCPVREYEWLEDWRCKMVYSESGVAEENCIFQTDFGEGPVTWAVSHYEPPRRIEFVIFLPERWVERLYIHLDPVGDQTRIEWKRLATGISYAGNNGVGRWRPDLDKSLTEKLEYFLKTGEKKRATPDGQR